MSTFQTTIDQRQAVPAEQRFLLRGIDWSNYRALSDLLTGRHLHLAYDRGNLEFMTISSSHANYGCLLARFIVVLAEEFNLPLGSYGDMTYDREDLDRGVELDRCFYLHNEPLIRGREKIDLAVDPPPDLGVEVEITRSRVSRLSICEALGFPEIWRFNGKLLRAYHRTSEGGYIESEYSFHFPFLKVQEMVGFLQKRTEMEENSLVRHFRDWVKDQIGRASQPPAGTTRDQPKRQTSRKTGNTKGKKK
jgi:Uma2 family endonuclease